MNVGKGHLFRLCIRSVLSLSTWKCAARRGYAPPVAQAPAPGCSTGHSQGQSQRCGAGSAACEHGAPTPRRGEQRGQPACAPGVSGARKGEAGQAQQAITAPACCAEAAGAAALRDGNATPARWRRVENRRAGARDSAGVHAPHARQCCTAARLLGGRSASVPALQASFQREPQALSARHAPPQPAWPAEPASCRDGYGHGERSAASRGRARAGPHRCPPATKCAFR